MLLDNIYIYTYIILHRIPNEQGTFAGTLGVSVHGSFILAGGIGFVSSPSKAAATSGLVPEISLKSAMYSRPFTISKVGMRYSDPWLKSPPTSWMPWRAIDPLESQTLHKPSGESWKTLTQHLLGELLVPLEWALTRGPLCYPWYAL